MENRLFTNAHILAWLQYFADNTEVDLEKVKLLDITRRNKNLIPTVESNSAVLVFTEAGHPDIFYRMWNAGLGECEVWYNEGSDPAGPIKHDLLRDMIDRGINASAGMLILNPNARSTYKIGMRNSSFSRGSVHYVGSEIRAVILNKMHLSLGDTVCVISGASIAVESALIAAEQRGGGGPRGRPDHGRAARAVADHAGGLGQHGAGDRVPAAPQPPHGVRHLHPGLPVRRRHPRPVPPPGHRGDRGHPARRVQAHPQEHL